MQAIKHDLPPTPNGFIECWSTIIDILRKQKEDPSYCMPVQLAQGTAATQSKGCGPVTMQQPSAGVTCKGSLTT